MSKEKPKFNIKIKTPTLANRAIVVEDDEFKRQLAYSVGELKRIINEHLDNKCKIRDRDE